MRKIFLITGLLAAFAALAQNPATVFTIPNKVINVPCGTNCTSINVSVPHIKQTTNYVITNPAYRPYAYTTPTGTELTEVYDDDTWSEKIQFPFAFSFCFFGINYPTVLVGSNASVTFDSTLAGEFNEWEILEPLPNTGQEPASIFGPLHDIDPTPDNNPIPTTRKIEWRVEGTAPKRRFIASYNNVALFDEDCNSMYGTHQIVLYENTGVIEVYIKDKPYCAAWNDGLAILGIQNKDRNMAVTAPGKNATVWGTNNMDSCFRFIPSGGAPMFKRAQLLVNNVVVATNTTDTSTTAPGVLNLNFPNVCPSADSTAYVVRVYYGSCSNPALETSFTDTVFVKKSTLNATVAKTDATCTTPGSITVTATGGTPPIQYSIDGGATYQSSNVFNNVAPGTYSVWTKETGICTITQSVTIGVTGSITVNAGIDTTICPGASFTRTAIGTATSYSWSPTTGVSNPAIAGPVFSPAVNTTYTVTATQGYCTAQDNFIVTIAPAPTVNAGPDATICAGRSFTPSVTGTATSYSWSPVTGVSNPAIMNPVLSPAATTTYIVTGTLGACTAQDNLVITVAPNPVVNAGPNATICAGGSITPAVTGTATSYSWSPATGVSNPAIMNPVLNPSATTTYIVTGTLGSCTAQDDIVITVAPNPVVNAGPDGTICAGASFTPTVTGTATSYSWAPTAGVGNTTSQNPTLSPLVTTTYTLTGTLGSCTAQDNVTVTVVQGAVANAGPDASILSGQTYQIPASGSAGTYLWTPATGLSSATVLQPAATPAVTTTYLLTVTTPQGCTASDDITITVVPYCIKPMEAFTPNGDGINDNWLITNGTCLKSAKAQVYNRLGAKVFESKDYRNDWQGTYNGKPLPDGTYYYVITYVLLNGKTEYLKGNVTILR